MKQIGRYEVIRELGRGAMGIVFEASDPLIRRTIAIKTIHLDGQDDSQREDLQNHLLREARAAGILTHPGIVVVHDIGRSDGVAYIAMERVDGPTLEEELASAGPMQPERALNILRQTADALDYAHREGIVHRDIKPGNIMLHRGSTVKITDFGLAKAASAQNQTRSGIVQGTLSYMAPEQIRAQPADGRSDQFSLAVTAYEMLTGKRPFDGDSMGALMYQILNQEPSPVSRWVPSLPSDVDPVFRKALSKDWKDRYKTCTEFVNAIETTLIKRVPSNDLTLKYPEMGNAKRNSGKSFFEFGDFRLDPGRRLLWRENQPVPLQPKAFDTLLVLVQHCDRVVPKDELMKLVWPDAFVEESNLSQNIFVLRKALGETAGERRFIVTVPGRGYRFAETVRIVAEQDEVVAESHPRAVASIELDSVPEAPAPGVPDPRIRPTRRMYLAIAAAILVVGGGGIWLAVRNKRPLITEQDSIVLADFENRTGDPAFDGTLQKVLEIEINQSPYLNVLPDQDVRQTLECMRRRPDEPITRQVGLEICQRKAAKAMMSGSIASLGHRYVLTLEALNCATGGVLTGVTAEAESKERVLRALDDTTAKIRQKLGESLASIRKFGAPMEQATTGSFEALKMFAQGDELRRHDKAAESVIFFKQAIELDPQFTLAFGRLAAVYANLNESGLAKQYAEHAFQLRDRTSERERLYMAARYYENVSGEAGKAIDNYEVWRNAYPRDWIPVNNLANKYTDLGQYDKAIEAAREAVTLNPNHAFPYTVLARAYKRATRFRESKAACESAIANHLDGWGIRGILYEIAFAEGDSAAMQRQVDWGAGKPTEDQTLMYEALAAATAGRLRDSRELFQRAFTLASKNGHPDNAGTAEVSLGSIEALFENFDAAKERAAAALAVEGAQVSEDAALVLARSGDLARAESLADGLIRKDPLNTLINEFHVPGIQAEAEIKRGRPEQAVDLLRSAAPFELRNFTVPYLRGAAYLAARRGYEAAQEFQKILRNQGVDAISPYYPLAHIGLAQAHALQGDKALSQCEYEAFFELWKSADQDIPILREARSAYAELVEHKPVNSPVQQCTPFRP